VLPTSHYFFQLWVQNLSFFTFGGGVSKSEIVSEILLTSCLITVVCPQVGFVAEGVDTGTKFTDVNLTEKVHNFNQS